MKSASWSYNYTYFQRLEEEKAHLQLELQARDDLIRVGILNYHFSSLFVCVRPVECLSDPSYIGDELSGMSGDS